MTEHDMVEAIAARVADLLADRQHRAPLDANGAAAYVGLFKPDGTPRGDYMLEQARRDRVPHARVGKFVVFRPDDLDAWLDQRARGPRSGA